MGYEGPGEAKSLKMKPGESEDGIHREMQREAG